MSKIKKFADERFDSGDGNADFESEAFLEESGEI